ncbi:MAG: hypothetical protein AAGC68_01600 [Verrucomicrobiota bacterium]
METKPDQESVGQGENQLALCTYRWEGVAFNLACALYFLTLAPTVVDAASAAMRDPEARVIWSGVLLIAIVLAELWAFPVKMRFVNEAIRDNGDAAGKAFYLWIFHLLVSVILIFMIAGSFGVKLSEGESDDLPWWITALMPVVVIKELAFFGFLCVTPEKEAPENPKYTRPKVKEWIADVILLAYACVAYSVTWSPIARGMDLDRENPVMFVVNLFLSGLIFLMFYLPLRIPYWIEEMAQAKDRRGRWRLIGSVLVVLVPAIWSLH